MFKLIVLPALVFSFFFSTIEYSSAQDIRITMKSDHPNQVMVKFYSMNRNHFWPAHNRSYVIKDYNEHTYHLACKYGEKICYGAWVKNRPNGIYWGIGTSKNNGCKRCCFTCDGGNYRAATLVR